LNYAAVASLSDVAHADAAVGEQIEIQAKYAGYIDRQTEEIERLRRFEDMTLPSDLDFSKVEGLSNEVKLKLGTGRPATLGHASRIPGVTPAAVSLLLIYLKKRGLLDRPSIKNISA
jgi:tRNA uridine 5-carboxymethylaminomethyl modification enzyme